MMPFSPRFWTQNDNVRGLFIGAVKWERGCQKRKSRRGRKEFKRAEDVGRYIRYLFPPWILYILEQCAHHTLCTLLSKTLRIPKGNLDSRLLQREQSFSSTMFMGLFFHKLRRIFYAKKRLRFSLASVITQDDCSGLILQKRTAYYLLQKFPRTRSTE